MINVILPVVENPEQFEAFVKEHSGKDVKFFVGIRRGLNFSSNLKNVELHTFVEKATAEEIVNALHTCNMQQGRILIARRPLTKGEFENLTTSDKEIATLKVKCNRFLTAFKNFAKNLVRRFFAFTFFDDISAICFNEEMFASVRANGNLSLSSRINKYVGVEFDEIDAEEKPVKKQYNRVKNISAFVFWTLLLIASIVGGALICSLLPIRALIVIIVVFWIILAAFFWFVGFINFMRTCSVGQLHYGRAEEV